MKVLLLALFLCLPAAAHGQDFVPGRILVKPRANVSDPEFSRRTSARGVLHHSTLPHTRVRILAVQPAQMDSVLAAFQSDPDIEFAERDYIAHRFATPNDPFVVSGNEWHLFRIQALQAWDFTTGISNVIIAVLDSGINAAHPDFAGRCLPGYDFVNNSATPADDFGHGTAVAGTVAANGNNALGVAGVSYSCTLLPVKVMDRYGSASHSTIAQGIEYAVQQGARIINLSLGGDWPSSTLQNAINYAWSNNVLVVAAAGNNGNIVPQYPAACDHVLAVAASEPDDSRCWFSSYGSYVTLFAPGDNIWTTQKDLSNPYGAWSGTSFSSPVVAGVAALVLSINPSLSNTQIVDVLKQTADDLGLPGYDGTFAYGRVNAFRAVSLANPLQQDPTPLPREASPVAPPVEVVPPPSPVPGGQVASTNQVSNPFRALKGSYTGLIANTNGITPDNSGAFTVAVGSSGFFSGHIIVAGRRNGFSGRFDSWGQATVSIRRGLLTPLTLALRLDLISGSDEIAGSLTDSNWTSDLAGDRNVFNYRTNPARQAGLRSLVLERAPDDATAAAAASRISASGATNMRGTLSDGRRFNTSSALAKNGDCPFCLSLNHGREIVIGWLNFPVGPGPSASGSVLWVKTGTNAFASTLQAAPVQQ